MIMQQNYQNRDHDLEMDEEPRFKPTCESLGGDKEMTENMIISKKQEEKLEVKCWNLSFDLNHQAYRTHSQLLVHTRIRPQDRQRLKSWLLSETQGLYHRETYATASKFLDIFFVKRGRVNRQNFQILGIACLMLAAKIVERRMPSISFQVFDKTQIFNFEKNLLVLMNFRVNPITYVFLGELMFYFWDNYDLKNHPFKQIQYMKDGFEPLVRFRTVMETFDCMDLVPETLNIPLRILVPSVFYVQNRKFCLQLFKIQQKQLGFDKLNQQHMQKFGKIYDSIMMEFFIKFSAAYPTFQSINLNQKVIFYIMSFSRLKPNITIPARYRNFRFQISKQTYHQQISQLAQRYMSRR